MSDHTSMFMQKVNQLDSFISPEMENDLPVDILRNEEIEKIRKKYKKRKKTTKGRAKQLINSCAKLFLDNKMMTPSEYAKNKMEIDTMSLSNTLFQLYTAHTAIENICVEIESGNASSKMYESLSYLQRIVLDINKFLCSYMSDMEQSYRELRDKIIEMDIEKSLNGEESDGMSKSSIVYTSRDKTDLLTQINHLLHESKDLKATPSMNPKLSKEGDDDELVDSMDRMMNDNAGSGKIEEMSGDEYTDYEEIDENDPLNGFGGY